MEIVTSIGVVALASMAAILINDKTPFGGHLEDGDDNFSLFAKAPAAITLHNEGTHRIEPSVKDLTLL